MALEQALKMNELQATQQACSHAMGVLSLDGETAAPAASAAYKDDKRPACDVLLDSALGAPFDPACCTACLTKKFRALYRL